MDQHYSSENIPSNGEEINRSVSGGSVGDVQVELASHIETAQDTSAQGPAPSQTEKKRGRDEDHAGSDSHSEYTPVSIASARAEVAQKDRPPKGTKRTCVDGSSETSDEPLTDEDPGCGISKAEEPTEDNPETKQERGSEPRVRINRGCRRVKPVMRIQQQPVQDLPQENLQVRMEEKEKLIVHSKSDRSRGSILGGALIIILGCSLYSMTFVD